MKARYRWILRLAVFAAAAWWIGDRLPAAPRATVDITDRIPLGFSNDGAHYLTVDSFGDERLPDRMGPVRYWNASNGRESKTLLADGSFGPCSAAIDLTADCRWAWTIGFEGEERQVDLVQGKSTLIKGSTPRKKPVGNREAELRLALRSSLTRGVEYVSSADGKPVRLSYWLAWPERGAKDVEAAPVRRVDRALEAASADGRLTLYLDREKGSDVLLWNALEERVEKRLDFSPFRVHRALLSPDGEQVAAQLSVDQPDSSGTGCFIQIVRWRDGRSARIAPGTEAVAFVHDGDRIVASRRTEPSADTCVAELWSTHEGRCLANWTIYPPSKRHFLRLDFLIDHDPPIAFQSAANSPWLLTQDIRSTESSLHSWIERLPVGVQPPPWMRGRATLRVLDARTGAIWPTAAFKQGHRLSPEWSTISNSANDDTLIAPGGRYMAVGARESAVYIYDFPFRPAWWMRALAGFVVLLLAELLARLMLLFIRPFLPVRRAASQVEPAPET